MNATEERIESERQRRLADQPWHYWEHSGRTEAPTADYWCEYCAGYFGVPHTHEEPGYCHFMYREHLCACIVCWVTQDRVDSRPLNPAPEVDPKGDFK